VRGTGWFVERL